MSKSTENHPEPGPTARQVSEAQQGDMRYVEAEHVTPHEAPRPVAGPVAEDYHLSLNGFAGLRVNWRGTPIAERSRNWLDE